MNILFVCSANKIRSVTAEHLFSDLYPNIRFDSAGTNLKTCQKEGTNPLTEELLEWADKVFVMERKHIDQIRKHTSNKYTRKIVNLGIPDVYEYGELNLKTILLSKVKNHLNDLS